MIAARNAPSRHAVVAVAGALHALYFDSDSPGLALFFAHDTTEQAAFGRSAVCVSAAPGHAHAAPV